MERKVRGLQKKDSSLMFREITPPHGWKDDSDFHYLRLTLPGFYLKGEQDSEEFLKGSVNYRGFEAKDISIHMDKYGHLVVRGNKQVTEHKYISFEETFDVSYDADLEEADGLFEDNQIYCITIPKKKGGQTSGHAISMPKYEETTKVKKFGSINRYGSNDDKPEGLSHSPRIPKNPLDVIKGGSSKRRIVFFIAILIALLFVTVFLIVKFRRR